VAGIHLTDLESEKHLAAHIETLNLLRRFVETVTPFPMGTKVRLKISHAGVNFIAIGKVAYSLPKSGMGNFPALARPMPGTSPPLPPLTTQSQFHKFFNSFLRQLSLSVD